MNDKNKSGDNAELLVWFNGMEIETIRYAIFDQNGDELDALEEKFDHKIENFESYDGLKINLTINELRKLAEITAKDLEKEKERNNAFKKDAVFLKQNIMESSCETDEYTFKLFYFRELQKIHSKLNNVLEKNTRR